MKKEDDVSPSCNSALPGLDTRELASLCVCVLLCSHMQPFPVNCSGQQCVNGKELKLRVEFKHCGRSSYTHMLTFMCSSKPQLLHRSGHDVHSGASAPHFRCSQSLHFHSSQSLHFHSTRRKAILECPWSATRDTCWVCFQWPPSSRNSHSP